MDIQLTTSQQEVYDAINNSLLSNCRGKKILVNGSAGTGKSTSVFAAIAEALKRNKFTRILFLAPTHSAVSVLSKIEHKFNLPAPIEISTITSALKMRPKRIKVNGAYKKRFVQTEHVDWSDRADIVLIDEVSMLSPEYIEAIEEASEYISLTIFLGDKCQLPPVTEEGEPKIDESPIFSAIEENYTLTEVMRYAGDSLVVANKIRDAMQESGFCTLSKFLPETSEQIIKIPPQNVKNIFAERFNNGQNVKVLAYTNSMVDALNDRIHSYLGFEDFYNVDGKLVNLHPAPLTDNLLMPIETSFTVKSFERKEFNCEVLSAELAGMKFSFTEIKFEAEEYVGTIKALALEEWDNFLQLKKRIAKMCNDGKPQLWRHHFFLEDNFINVRLPYATTIHKSQGNTYDDVILFTPDLGSCRDHKTYNNVLYTGFTRSSGNIYLVWI